MPDSSPRFALDAAHSALVIKPSSLGDVIHTLPAVTRLHRHRPDLDLDWVVNTEWAPLLRDHPNLRRVIPMPRRDWRGWRDLPKAKRWADETLGGLRPDLVLDFQGLLRSALLAKASGGSHLVGFQRAREGAPLLYDQKISIPDWNATHAVDRYLALVEALGVPPLTSDDLAADPGALFPLPPGDPVSRPDFVFDQDFLLLHPFSRGRGKSLNFSETADFCHQLERKTGLPVVLVGAGITWHDAGEIAKPPGLIDLLDQTSLAQLIWLMRRARFVVSVDSGPMHLAAALTGRLLSLHTWTDPLMVGPWRKDAWIWRQGLLCQVGDVAPGQLPEQRARRQQFETGILSDRDIDQVTGFLANQLHP